MKELVHNGGPNDIDDSHGCGYCNACWFYFEVGGGLISAL
jgi:hypothetical protein